MKRWMSLVVGIALIVAGCASTGTSDTTVAGGTPATVATTVATPTTAAPATTLAATTTSGPTTTAPAPPPPTTAAPAPTTTAAPATTLIEPAVYYAVDDPSNPTYYPASLPGAAPYFGSGCTPGAGPLPDGIWFGELTSVGPDSFEFDLMCFAPNPPGSTEEDGIGDITNSNPTLRTVPVNASAHVYVLDAAMNWMDMLYQTWSVAPTLGNGCPPSCGLQGWIYVNGGEATEIMMAWTP